MESGIQGALIMNGTVMLATLLFIGLIAMLVAMVVDGGNDI